MQRLKRLQSLAMPAKSKILLYVLDGVGGVPHPDTGKTELEASRIPSFHAFAAKGVTGRTVPFGLGVAPGSGPGHLALFGYPNDQIELNRGVLEVLGARRAYRGGTRAEFGLQLGDVAARGNFATVDPSSSIVLSRRAGVDLTDTENETLVRMLSERVHIKGVEVTLFPGKGHRFAVAFRGSDLDGQLHDLDPQRTGVPVPAPQGMGGECRRTCEVVGEFVKQVQAILLERGDDINYVLLRGIGGPPLIPTLESLYGIRCACLATYPMYRGIARLLGMTILEVPDHEAQVRELERQIGEFDFFYLHIKETDSYGHKMDFAGKVGVLEEVDPLFRKCQSLPFDVVVVSGDHSTPTAVGDHTYHPVPTALWSTLCMRDPVTHYHERAVVHGWLGTIDARDLMPIALAEAGRLAKFGA